jgi:acetyl/propionyl-CoA carboxylase alpha subunit
MNKQHTRISKVLIANRGEIALRIQRACNKMGIKTVSVASEADKDSLFARRAEELVIIGPAAARDSYLRGDKLIEVAKERGCDALHPGYGFLSENADFAQKVVDSGLNFIGPSPQSIAALGSKTRAKAIASAAKVPCAPSSPAGLSDEELIVAAEKIGYPVLVKAVAGGGGRGMRNAFTPAELAEALPRARGEALKFFSNEDIYLEKLIDRPRHVEVQIFGDKHGNLVHLGTRDCSTQRRHQKLIEEAPAPHLAPELRERIHQAALAAARESGYYNAGTVEFLVKDGEFFFLEVNTRIQVEHPVTEAITGLDLVELQLRVAQGEPLPFKQSDVRFTGHAIEFRICAEDPAQGFRPATGKITTLTSAKFPWVREDTGFLEGDTVSAHYDSMLSKVIVHGGSRGDAIDKSLEFLSSYAILGVPSTIALHLWALYNGEFRSRPLDIGYVEREFSVKILLGLRAAEVRDPEWRLPVGTVGNCLEALTLEEALPNEQNPGSGEHQADKTSKGPSKGDLLGALKARELLSSNLSDELGPIGATVTTETVNTQNPRRQNPKGATVKNVYQYQSEKFKTTYTIEILHKRDGFFVAVPVDSAGRRGKSNNCRMSNGLNTVVHSLIHDVLEKTPPSEIF